MQQLQLQYLQHEQIDKVKWDACISSSLNSMIYAYAGYLDTMADHWDALIYGDYVAVMPLTWRKKYGIKYLYQPAFIQQLGVFSSLPVNDELIQRFIQSAGKSFKFCEIFLNEGNTIELENSLSYSLTNRTNYVVRLDHPHEEIVRKYKDTLLQDINKARRHPLFYIEDIEISTLIHANKKFLSGRTISIRNVDFIQFNHLCDQLHLKGMCITRGVKDNKGELLAQVILLKDRSRIYNIMSVVTPSGRALRANHFLYDSILKEFEHSGLIFDFEGSDLPGVKEFYRSFGAINRPYYFLRYNELPWWMKIFKK